MTNENTQRGDEDRFSGEKTPMPRGILDLILPLLILALGVGLVLYYIIWPAAGYMTSDCTDSLRWAEATYKSGQLVSDNFYYAAILPFGGNLLFLPFVALFGYSMAAQISGLAVFALLFAAALYYLATGVGLNRYCSAGLVAVFMLIMSSSAKLREIMWEHVFYYNLGLLFFCFGFGLACRILREGGFVYETGKRRASDWARLAVFVVFVVLAATDGLQTLICLTLPLVCGIFAERLFDAGERIASKKNLMTLVVLASVIVASTIGLALLGVISRGVSAGYADAYSTYSAMSSWVDNFLSFPINWFWLLGVSVSAGDPLVSLESIYNMVGIFGGLILLAAPEVLLCRYNKITNPAVKILLVGHFAVSAFILFAVTFGKLGGADWRLTPMLGTSVILSFVTAVELIKQKKVAARAGALLLAALIVMAAVPAIKIAGMSSDYGRENSWHVAAGELEARGLEYGYANFWWAELITMLSGGEVQVANIAAGQPKPLPYKYQVPKDSFDDKDTDRYFLLLTESENAAMASWLSAQRYAGKIVEEFTIESEPYNLRGYVGKLLYVYVFSENLF